MLKQACDRKLIWKKPLPTKFQCLMSSYLYQRLSVLPSFLINLSTPVECVSTAIGAQGCKGSIHYTRGASLYCALVTRALLRIKPSDLRQMVFNMLRGKAPFTSYIPTSLMWLIDNIVLDNKCQRLKDYDVVYDDLSAL